ncbi:MAG: lysozyme [Limisphaerales bacterium]
MDQIRRLYKSKITNLSFKRKSNSSNNGPRKQPLRRKKSKKSAGFKRLASVLLVLFFLCPFLFIGYQRLSKKPSWLYPSLGVRIPQQYAILGIDVSRYQGEINWEETANSEIPVQFAFLKASEGTQIKDPSYKRNVTQASKQNIKIGAYHFFRPELDGKAQAEYFHKIANPKPGDLPPVLDVEAQGDLTNKALSESVSAWLKRESELCNCKPIIYSNLDFYKRIFNKEFPNAHFWIARYGKRKLDILEKDKRVLFWQFSEEGSVNGIGHLVDLNVFHSDSLALEALLLK